MPIYLNPSAIADAILLPSSNATHSSSPDQLRPHFPRSCQRQRTASGVGEGRLRVDAEQVKRGGDDVLGRDGAIDHVAGDFVRLPDDAPAAHPTAGIHL